MLLQSRSEQEVECDARVLSKPTSCLRIIPQYNKVCSLMLSKTWFNYDTKEPMRKMIILICLAARHKTKVTKCLWCLCTSFAEFVGDLNKRIAAAFALATNSTAIMSSTCSVESTEGCTLRTSRAWRFA